jgi:hypothetical protein
MSNNRSNPAATLAMVNARTARPQREGAGSGCNKKQSKWFFSLAPFRRGFFLLGT